MESINIYKFAIYYSVDDDKEPMQFRYVVAESSDEAWEKVTTHFEMMHREGYAKPFHIAEPTVEIQGAII